MTNPNDALPIFPSFDAPGGHGALLDHVQQIKRRDFADDDVRAAVRSVAANENKHRIASELGLDGITAAEQWDRRIEEVGPRAAIEAAQLYSGAPRFSPPPQEDRQEGDHEKSARAAYRQVQEREQRQANLPAAMAGLDRLEQRHGLGVVDTFRRWDQQLRENPQDAAPRVATEIATRINDSQANQQASQVVNAYLEQQRVSDEERAVMHRVLASGEMQDLPSAHAFARYQLAYDVKDGHARDVEAARRQREGVEMYQARLTVSEWDRRHPNVSYPVRSRMKQLLSEGRARDYQFRLRNGPAMSDAPETDDHQHLLDSVRDAMEQHHSEAEPSHQSVEHHEAADHDHAATEIGLQVAAVMNQEERQRSSEQSGKQRDIRGRFKSARDADEAGSGPAATASVPEAVAVTPPSSWSPEAKAAFENLPAAVKGAIAKREAEVSSGFSQYRDRTQSAAQIESLLEPRRQVFQHYGLNDAQAIERLMVVSDGLSRNAAGTIAFLAEQFGVAPHQVFPNVQSGPSHEQVEQYVQQRIDAALAQTEVQRFESKAPEHYGLVKGLMQQLLQSGAASSMQDAYRQACQHHPAVLSIEQQRRERERIEKKLRASGHSLDGAPHGVSATPPRSNGRAAGGKFGDVADDVRAAMAALS